MRSRIALLAAVAALFVMPVCTAFAQPTPGAFPGAANVPKPLPFVSPIFGDNMVLQRGKLNSFWGWSDPGDTIKVQIGESTASGLAGDDRRWQVKIMPPAVGGPYTVEITGHQSVTFNNVLVGDVWLCGGQSNMGLPLRMTANADEEVKSANFPEIRFFTVGGRPAYNHTGVIDGSWKVLSPRKRQTGFRRSLIISAKTCRTRSTCPSAWLSMRWVELRPRHGPALPRFVRSKTSMSRWPKSIGWPQRARPSTATTSTTGTTNTTSA